MADFSLAPDYVFVKKTGYDTIVSEFENGAEQRRARRSGSIRSWRLSYRNKTTAELATVQTLFDAKKGALTSFTWTNPTDSVDYTVRFKEDSLEVAQKAYGVFDFDFELVEVI